MIVGGIPNFLGSANPSFISNVRNNRSGIQFDGDQNEGIYFNHSQDYEFFDKNFTIEFWVNFNSILTGDQVLIELRQSRSR